MPSSCCAIGCVSRYSKKKHIKLFRFPTEKKRREAWIRAIRREKWIPNKYSRICQFHFIFKRPSRDPSNPDFVPTIFSFSKENEEALSEKTARHDRFLRRRLMKSNSVMGSIQSTELETISGESVPTEHECDEDGTEHECDEDGCSERVSDRRLLFCYYTSVLTVPVFTLFCKSQTTVAIVCD